MNLHGMAKRAACGVLPRSVRPRRLRFGPARGVRMNIDFDRHLAVYFGIYERELNRHFRRLIRPGDKSFDIGGHNGYDALLIAKLSGGPVVSIESNGANIPVMKENFAINAFDIRAVRAYVAESDDGNGRASLDRLAEKHFVPDFIKMDIEGGEVDALQGAAKLIERKRPAMIVEVHGADREAQCLAMLRGWEYDVQIVGSGAGPLREQRGVEHNRWLVCDRPASS